MSESTEIKKQTEFSLIELLMIIMVVGIAFTLIIPLKQDRVNKAKLAEGIKNVQIIAREDVKFYNNPYNNYYAFDLDMLDLDGKLEKTGDVFVFDYSLTDSTIVATTNDNFGVTGASFFYYLPQGPYQLAEDNVSQQTFDSNWLP
jgi:competence protein ComGC